MIIVAGIGEIRIIKRHKQIIGVMCLRMEVLSIETICCIIIEHSHPDSCFDDFAKSASAMSRAALDAEFLNISHSL